MISYADAQGDWNSVSNENIFTKHKIDFKNLQSQRNRIFTNIAFSNNTLILSTSDNFILRSQLHPEADFDEIEIPTKGTADSIRKLYLSICGQYLVISRKSGDNYILFGGSDVPFKISKLIGNIESVSFDNQRLDGKVRRTILVSTSTGKIYDITVDGNGKEKSCQLVHQLESSIPITSLYFHSMTRNISDSSYFVFYATVSPLRIYYYFGGPTFQQLFTDSLTNEQSSFTEFPGDMLPNVEIHCNYSTDNSRSLQFSIWTKNGIYCGSFLFSNEIKR